MWPISEGAKEATLKKLGKTEKSLQEDVETIQKWMKTQLHLPEILDAHTIRNFLLMNKCRIEKTKSKIDNYYTVRSVYPELNDNAHPRLPEIQKIMDTIYLFPLPKLTEKFERVVIYKVRNRQLMDKLNFRCCCAHVKNFGDLLLREICYLPFIIVVDVSDVSIECVKRCSPNLMMQLFSDYQKVLSFSPNAIYIVNAPSYINIFLQVGKMVLKPKIWQRIQFIRDTADLDKLISKDVLPRDYGGEEKSLEELNESMKLKFREYWDFFDHREKMRVDESLRLNKLQNDEFLGFHGSFKMLEID